MAKGGLRAREEHYCVTLFPSWRYKGTHTYVHTLPSSNRWEDVSQCELWAPPSSLFSHPRCLGQLGGRHSFFSAFRGKQKSVWDPSYTHVHVFRHTTRPTTTHTCTKKLSMQLWADQISAAWAQQLAEVWVLSLGHLLKVKVRDNPYQSWHTHRLGAPERVLMALTLQ